MTRLIALICFLSLILPPASVLASDPFKCKALITLTINTKRSDRTCFKWSTSDTWRCIANHSSRLDPEKIRHKYMKCGQFVPEAHKLKLHLVRQEYAGSPMANLCSVEISAKVLDLLLPLMTNFKINISDNQRCVITKRYVDTLGATLTLTTQ